MSSSHLPPFFFAATRAGVGGGEGGGGGGGSLVVGPPAPRAAGGRDPGRGLVVGLAAGVVEFEPLAADGDGEAVGVDIVGVDEGRGGEGAGGLREVELNAVDEVVLGAGEAA